MLCHTSKPFSRCHHCINKTLLVIRHDKCVERMNQEQRRSTQSRSFCFQSTHSHLHMVNRRRVRILSERNLFYRVDYIYHVDLIGFKLRTVTL